MHCILYKKPYDKNVSKTSTSHYQPEGSKDKLISSKTTTEGAAKIASDLISASEGDDPGTLIDIKITNPLKKIYELINEIKKKQSTTLSLKLTIPLVALPIFLFVAFQLGKDQALCEQYFTSRIGIVKTLDVEEAVETGGLLSKLKIKSPTTVYEHVQRTILIDSVGSIITILNQKQVDISKYENTKVVITGTYSSCTDVITLVSKDNITPL